MWVATTYMASISVAQEVKWCWFILSLCGLAGYIFSLVRTYKPAAEARSEGVSEVRFSSKLSPLPWRRCPGGFLSARVQRQYRAAGTSSRATSLTGSCCVVTMVTALH